MAQFCTQCGNPLDQCTCTVASTPSGLMSGMKARMGIGDATESKTGIYERGFQIVPDSIAKDESEIPIRQYDMAILRTRWQFKRAEGRLQVTNKRVIFRANGRSLMGRTLFQQEFSISEIGGMDLRKDWRFGGFDFIFGAFTASLVTTIFAAISGSVYDESPIFGSILAFLFGIGLQIPFFIVNRRFLIKLLSCAASVGFFAGAAIGGFDFLSKLDPFSSGSQGSGNGFMIFLMVLAIGIETVALFLFSFKQNLLILVKGKGGAGEAVMVAADIGSGFLAKLLGQGNSGLNCGFSEVLPTKATDTAIREVGAMIHDIQALGDFAVEKWKEI